MLDASTDPRDGNGAPICLNASYEPVKRERKSNTQACTHKAEKKKYSFQALKIIKINKKW